MLIDVAFVLLTALLGNLVFNKLGLPGILGMIGAGMLVGPSGLNLIEPGVLVFLKEAKTVALIVILIRAGLGISKETLHRIGGPAIRMGFIPCLLEGAAVTAAAYFLLHLPFFESGMLGFIFAAVSPAVVVPSMLQLTEEGFGKKKEVPTLILAGASLDDVFAITLFGTFAGLAAGASTNWGYLLLGVPGGILLGALVGAVFGYGLFLFFKRFPMRDTKKVIVFMILAVVFYDLCESPTVKEWVPVAALLGIMAMGFVILEKNDTQAHRLASKFGKIWVLAEILLFAYIGTEVRIRELDAQLLGVGLLVLCLGLGARSLGVWVSLWGSALATKERAFCVIAYLPKATVQAAMGAVPLAMVLEGKMTHMTEDSGKVILAMAVLSIVVSAPLGAVGIKLLGSRLLERG